MGFAEALCISKGLTAIIGGGGKTSLLTTLAGELSRSVIVCTSTRIFPPEGIPTVEHVTDFVDGILCVGTPVEHGKLGRPLQSFEELCGFADYVLVEADGSKHLPIKAHDTYEPVIPEGSTQTILVIGASGLGKPAIEVVHRPHIFTRLTASELASPEAVALAIEKENLGDRIFINQSDLDRENAMILARLLQKPGLVGSIQKGEILCLF